MHVGTSIPLPHGVKLWCFTAPWLSFSSLSSSTNSQSMGMGKVYPSVRLAIFRLRALFGTKAME